MGVMLRNLDYRSCLFFLTPECTFEPPVELLKKKKRQCLQTTFRDSDLIFWGLLEALIFIYLSSPGDAVSNVLSDVLLKRGGKRLVP